MKRICVSGGFDPLHVGHLEYFERAKSLGDYLIVIVNSDEFLLKKKGYIFMPIEDRIRIIKSLRIVDEVVECIDKDQTVTETLKQIRPDVFVNGGDAIPVESEVKACESIGCKTIYNICPAIRSSSKLINRILLQRYDYCDFERQDFAI